MVRRVLLSQQSPQRGTGYTILFLIIVLVCSAVMLQVPATVDAEDTAAQLLRRQIEPAGKPPKICVGTECIFSSEVLPLFYERRSYQPAWSTAHGLSTAVPALVAEIEAAFQEGLEPTDYHLAKIQELRKNVENVQSSGNLVHPQMMVELDLLLTDAFLTYASHLLAGRVNPETIDPEWQVHRREKDLPAHLQTALETGTVQQALQSLLPVHPGYQYLRKTLEQYRHIAQEGGWPQVPDGPTLHKNECSDRIVALRNRLIVSGDIRKTNEQEDFFDEILEEAVRTFQYRHGLDVDGIIGPATLEALNVPVESRIRQVILNLERWRWLPQYLGNRYILINIADFDLQVVDGGEAVMTMRVVVGRNFRPTPVFSDRITYMVLCPYWHVPKIVAMEDIVPMECEYPGYLQEQHFQVFLGWGEETIELDPREIHWCDVTSEGFAYRFRQEPGPLNALGRMKFMFPNQHNVYLHDTPARDLFYRSSRAFSSGCIRIEKPLALAEYLLQKDPRWTREALVEALDKNVERIVDLPEDMPVHLLYWTAWAEREGIVHFRNDIYGRDESLRLALSSSPPKAF